MPEEKDKLIKPQNPDESPKGIATTGGKVKITGKSRLHSALSQTPVEDPAESFRKAAATATASQVDKQNDPLTATNRIAIMADVSGSMNSSGVSGNSRQAKIDLLKLALTGFLNQVNSDTTSVAIYTFPLRGGWEHPEEDEVDQFGGFGPQGIAYRLSFDKTLLQLAVQGLSAGGGTPMHSTMGKVIDELPLTRGIIISDGEANAPQAALDYARKYAASETIIDTVHIGGSSSGERLLQEIASITGGVYIKFDNVDAFAKAFEYLTPEKRATLMLPGAAALLGAKELKLK
jgi:hypothetical protein